MFNDKTTFPTFAGTAIMQVVLLAGYYSVMVPFTIWFFDEAETRKK